MTAPAPGAMFGALDRTWPPVRSHAVGPWRLREGAGGGKRVSAATCEGPWQAADLSAAESAMRLLGQAPLFMIRPGEAALDAALADRGYARVDPTRSWSAPVAQLADRPVPRLTVFALWEPLAIMREIWAEGGIGPARQAIMARTQPPRTSLFGRMSDKPAGAGFCAVAGDLAMVHALEVRPAQRRQGLAASMMRAAAAWAQAQGARDLAVLCTEANGPANALYARLRMRPGPGYHYRAAPAPPEED